MPACEIISVSYWETPERTIKGQLKLYIIELQNGKKYKKWLPKGIRSVPSSTIFEAYIKNLMEKSEIYNRNEAHGMGVYEASDGIHCDTYSELEDNGRSNTLERIYIYNPEDDTFTYQCKHEIRT